RESGWAASEQELNENNAVAAPLRGRNGGIELILLALGFAEELGGEEIGRTGELLAAIAEEIRVSAGLVAEGDEDEATATAGVG
ncbi:MAG: hypothetical protein KJ006_00525, partial [Thermoleophilia bacterium]|nr:hypothetical protein [Thermoleophilia bacterium]